MCSVYILITFEDKQCEHSVYFTAIHKFQPTVHTAAGSVFQRHTPHYKRVPYAKKGSIEGRGEIAGSQISGGSDCGLQTKGWSRRQHRCFWCGHPKGAILCLKDHLSIAHSACEWQCCSNSYRRAHPAHRGQLGVAGPQWWTPWACLNTQEANQQKLSSSLTRQGDIMTHTQSLSKYLT